ncbi:MAG TPA: hypothetical protein VFW94_17590, partial [Candidatus Acidoferrales bacterium]|nr:hypothetical protein [Candidatus Acidoferrales bacterium]
LTIEIHDAKGNLVRRFTSVAPAPDNTPKNVPDYWFGPMQALTKHAGLNRFVWDLRYPDPDALNYSYYGNILDYVEYTLSDHAVPSDTPRKQAIGPRVTPGQYTVTFIGNGVLMTQPLTVGLDPRVHVSQADLDQQLQSAQRITSALKASYDAFNAAGALRAAVAEREKSLEKMAPLDAPGSGDAGHSAVKPEAAAANKDAISALEAFDTKVAGVQQGTGGAEGVGPVNRDLARILYMVEVGDGAPSDSAQAAIDTSCKSLDEALAQWKKLQNESLPTVNAMLSKYNLDPLTVAAEQPTTAQQAPAAAVAAPSPSQD